MRFNLIIVSTVILSVIVGLNSYANTKIIIKTENNINAKILSGTSIFSDDAIETITEIKLKKNKASISASMMNEPSTWILHLKENNDIDEFLKLANNNPHVIYAEEVYPINLFSKPNDPLYKDQYYLNHNHLKKIIDLIPRYETVVAVLDTGVDVRHLDLEQSIYINTSDPINDIDDDSNGIVDDYNGANFLGFSEGSKVSSSLDEHGHGTHIAGLIAAQSNNQEGITGLNSKAKILNVRFLDQFGRGNQVDAAAAIVYAVDQGAKIINCSWGYFKSNTILQEAINYALNHHVIVVAAIGNSNTNLKEYPAAYEGVYAIGSIDKTNKRSAFSSFGEHLDFLLLGEALISPILHDQYDYKSGTSQAAAIMSGIVSKFISIESNLNSETIYSALISASSLKGEKSYKEGYGTLNINTLIPLLTTQEIAINEESLSSSSEFSLHDVLNFPNPIPRETPTTFGFSTDIENLDYTIQIFNLLGELEKELEGKTVAGYNRVVWSPENMYKGTYLYLLHVSSSQKSKLKRGKLSVL